MTRIAVLDDYQGVALELGPWGELAETAEITVFGDHVADEDELVERLASFEIVVAMRERTPFPRDVIERLGALRLLVTTGMANAAIDVEAAHDLGVVVSGTGSLGTGTVELTWALILGLSRNLAVEDRGLRDGNWQQSVGTDLAGATLGLVGLGRLGSRVAAIGRAFEMRVVAWSQNLDPAHAAAVGAEAVAKHELFATSDVVSVHLKLSDRTVGLVGAGEIGAMKSTAYLVNTSRGPIVDEVALLSALHGGTIAGAGLDVFETEPLPIDHPLCSAPRTLLTPHLGYVTKDTYRLYFGDVVTDIAAFLAGRPVRVLSS